VLRVLLVCTGNICRSPLAHGFLADRSLRYLGGRIAVRSAGTWARDGGPATAEAVAAGTEAGIDIAPHRSSRFRADLADWADLVITMTAEQRDEVLAVSPGARTKAFTLKEAAALMRGRPPVEGPLDRSALLARIAEADQARQAGAPLLADEDVADPLGMSALTYRAVAAEIEGLVDGLLRGLGADLETPSAAEA
jgi:protein-tyrosine phosphatase